MSNQQILILMGFKSVGKSTIGQALSKNLNCEFFDLDQLLEKHYNEKNASSLTCREIFHHHGQEFFKRLENIALKKIMNHKSEKFVLALGGNTPLVSENQKILKLSSSHCVLIYLEAERDQVFCRMMKNGRPAFITPEEDPKVAFDQLWNLRLPIYQQLADITVSNVNTVDQSVDEVLSKLNQSGELR